MRVHVKDIGTAIGVRIGTLLSATWFGVAMTEHELNVIVAAIGVACGLLFDAVTGALVRSKEGK